MIQQKRKLCNNCNTEQFIWKNDKAAGIAKVAGIDQWKLKNH